MFDFGVDHIFWSRTVLVCTKAEKLSTFKISGNASKCLRAMASFRHLDIPQNKWKSFLGRLIAPFLFGSINVCSSEHSDLPPNQRFMNALWLGFVDHIFIGVNKKALSLCTFVVSVKISFCLN